MKNILFNQKVQQAIEIAVSLFGLYILYQITRRMLGGSWSIEELIFGLVVLHIGFTFGLAIKMAELKTEFKHHRIQFHALATDFKDLKEEVKEMKEQITNLNHKIDLSLKKRK